MEVKPEYIDKQHALNAICEVCGVIPDSEKEICPYRLAGCKEYASILDVISFDTMYGYTISDLLVFAHACKLYGVKKYELKSFVQLTKEMYEVFSKKDVMPVVFCKDCKHREYMDNRIPSERDRVCWMFDVTTKDTDFCSFGEKKE